MYSYVYSGTYVVAAQNSFRRRLLCHVLCASVHTTYNRPWSASRQSRSATPHRRRGLCAQMSWMVPISMLSA